MSHTKSNLEKKIFKAGGLVLLAHLLFKLAGLIQAKVMGHYLDPATFDVVYAFAFENCIFMLFLIVQEIIGPAFLPVFIREFDENGEDKAWSFTNTVLTVQFLILLGVAGLLVAFPDVFVRVLTRWTAANAPDKYGLAVKSVRILAPAVVGLSLGTTTYVLLNGYKRFFLAAFGDAVWKFCAIAFCIVGAVCSRDVTMMLLWGLVAGAFCKVATHLFGLRDKLPRFRPMLDFSNPAFRRLCWLILPLLAGILVSKVRDVVNNAYLLSALEESGLLQANSMGRKLQATFLFLVPYTLSVAAFPYFCELVDKRDHQQMGQLLTKFGRILLAVFVPFSVFVVVSCVPMTALLFKGGHFDALAVQRTSVSLACYTAVLPAAALEALFMQAFFASRRMVSVTVIGILFSALSVAISWAGLVWFGTRNSLILLGCIAGGFALSRSLKTLVLVIFFRRTVPAFPPRETCGFLIRLCLASALSGAAAWGCLHLFAKQKSLVQLAAAGAAFAITYLVCAKVLRVTELSDLTRDLLAKVLKKRDAKGVAS
ncbi:MAG: hypothetical protein IJR99_09240 [Kiritimatiellae bacterium]|nr:hypothetical protein [Kiritimatiellia bacterium]